MTTNKQALREELSNPANGSNAHLRKLALALLDELEAAERRNAELSSAVIAPGVMRCAGCGFVLTKNSINMAAGSITAGDSKTEPCPNGCGSLWPVTWKEQAIEMRDSSEQWFEELQAARKRNAALIEFIQHVKKCLVKNGEYSPLSHETIDTILGIYADGISIAAATDNGV